MSLRTTIALDGEVLVPLRSGEMAALLREGHSISARFGTGGAALVKRENEAACRTLESLRGITFSNGGGI